MVRCGASRLFIDFCLDSLVSGPSSRISLTTWPYLWTGVALQWVAAILKLSGMPRLRDIVLSFDPGAAESVIEMWFSQAPARPAEVWMASELAVHVRDEQSTFTWLLEPLLERVGFEIWEAAYSSSRVYAAYTCVKG